VDLHLDKCAGLSQSQEISLDKLSTSHHLATIYENREKMLPAGEPASSIAYCSNIAASSYCAVPLRVAVCGVPGALSLTVSVPVKVPAVFDENVTLIVQVAPIARLAPQLFVCENRPLADIPLIVSGAVPGFDKVTGSVLFVRRGMVPKGTALGDNTAAGWTPVPVSDTLCGLVGSEFVMVKNPVSTPVVVGMNLTLTRQLRPGARLVPQLVLSEKLALHAKLIPVIVVMPTFEIVTV
jgi:hypothetical protein